MGRFFILSDAGDGVGLAMRLKAEGHEVRMKIFDSGFDCQGKGLIDFEDHFTMGQTVIADVTGFGEILDSFRDSGVRIFGGGSFADRLEKDRRFAEEVFHEVNIQTPESDRAKTWDDAATLVSELGSGSGSWEGVVLKPEGALSGVVPSYVATDVKDALAMLERFEKEHASEEVDLTIQEFIKGVALSTEGWFDGYDWVEGMFNHTIERKQFLNDDIGPSGGCTGNVIWPCDSDDPIVKQTLTKLTKVLRKHLYVGPIDVNCVVNKEGVYALEFTPRFGYDAFPTLLCSLCDFDFGAFIDDLARGSNSNEHLTEGFGAGVRLSVPPWPSEQFRHEGGSVLKGLSEEDKGCFYPYGMQFVDEELKTTSGVGIVGVVNGHGSTINRAFGQVYRIIEGLKMPDLQYRTDLHRVCSEDFEVLENAVSASI